MMFNFFEDMGNYSDRKVGRDNFDWGFVSTAKVSDGRKPYETAVEHKEYNDGDMVIVDCYDTKEEAEKGHAKWVANMTDKTLPEKLVDCANAEIAQLCNQFSPMIFPRKAQA